MANSVDQLSCLPPSFVTLTYHDHFPSPRASKKHLKAFLERVKYSFPEVWGMWKLEPQKRGAPHFHLMLFGPAPDAEWVARVWHRLAGAGSPQHLAWHLGQLGSGNRPCVERAKSWTRVNLYMSKYFSKPIGGEEWAEFGRAWGQVAKLNRHRYVTLIEQEGTEEQADEYERRMRHLREKQAAARWVIQATIADSDGERRTYSLNVSKFPDVALSLKLHDLSRDHPDLKPDRPVSTIGRLLSIARIDLQTDFRDRAARKEFRASLRRPGRIPEGLRLSLRYVGSRSWSSPVESRTVNGIESTVRVHRPCRTAFLPSSEAERLWHWAADFSESKMLALVDSHVFPEGGGSIVDAINHAASWSSASAYPDRPGGRRAARV